MTPLPPSLNPELERRRTALGVMAWRVDSGAGMVEPCDTGSTAEVGIWLGGEPSRAALSAATELADAADATRVVEPVPGLLYAHVGPRHGSRPPAVIAGAITQGYLTSPAFRSTCAAANVSDAAVAKGLAAFAHANRPAAVRSLHAFRWSVGDQAAAHDDRQLIAQSSERLERAFEVLNLLSRLSTLMNVAGDVPAQLRVACGQVCDVLSLTWVAACFNAGDGYVGSPIVAGQPPCDPAALPNAIRIFLAKADAGGGEWPRILGRGALPADISPDGEVLVERIAYGGRTLGVLMAGGKRGPDEDFNSEDSQVMGLVAELFGAFHENADRYAEQRALFLGTVRALSGTLDAKDPYTRGHSDRVALLAAQMAAALGLDARAVEGYRLAGIVHDLGKIGVAEAILRKPGRLTEDEFAQMRQHPVIGHRILEAIPGLDEALPAVLHHHERWDGRGYPHGLGGGSIPFIARVLALADSFDAMSSNRAYRPAMPRDQVIAEVRRGAGTQFDPQLVPTFIALDFSDFDRLLSEGRSLAA